MSNTPCNVPVKYDVGDAATLSGAFAHPDTQAPVDPGQVFLRIVKPDGTETTWQYGVDSEINRDDVGKYHAQIDIDQAGDWYYSWFSEGYGQAAEQRYFGVRGTGPSECGDYGTGRSGSSDVVAFANENPKRVRNDQGEVEARSADDIIKLQNHQQKQKAGSRHSVLQNSIVRGSKYPSC